MAEGLVALAGDALAFLLPPRIAFAVAGLGIFLVLLSMFVVGLPLAIAGFVVLLAGLYVGIWGLFFRSVAQEADLGR